MPCFSMPRYLFKSVVGVASVAMTPPGSDADRDTDTRGVIIKYRATRSVMYAHNYGKILLWYAIAAFSILLLLHAASILPALLLLFVSSYRFDTVFPLAPPLTDMVWYIMHGNSRHVSFIPFCLYHKHELVFEFFSYNLIFVHT